jgi:hypothetical protein
MPGITDIDLIRKMYDKKPYASFPCPTELFVHLIGVNDLRERRVNADCKSPSASHQDSLDTKTQQKRSQHDEEADRILQNIIAFKVDRWTIEKDANRGRIDAWTSIATMYHNAMVIFATLSLSIAPAPAKDPVDPLINVSEEAGTSSVLDFHICRLAAELKSIAKRKEPISMAACWPMIVLGVAARLNGMLDHRDLVSRCLSRLAVEHGTLLPFRAKEVLEKFWASGKTSWDECFDQAYAFFT